MSASTMERTVQRGNPVRIEIRRAATGDVETIHTHNLRTNAGADFQKNQMSGTAAAVANFIGVTANATAASAADTTLTAEETLNGLARATGTFNGGAAGTTSYTLSKTFTYSGGSPITLAKAGMFNAATVGTMVFEAVFGSTATLVSGDQITVTWTVNI